VTKTKAKSRRREELSEAIEGTLQELVPKMAQMMHDVTKREDFPNSTSFVLQTFMLSAACAMVNVCRQARETPPPDGWKPTLEEFKAYARLFEANLAVNAFDAGFEAEMGDEVVEMELVKRELHS